jgi:hypothetical protein
MSFYITYYSFSPERADKKWASDGDTKILELAKIYPNSDLASPDIVEEVIAELKNADLELGGVSNKEFAGAVIIEESKSLMGCIDALHIVYGLIAESETLIKENLFHIYKNLLPEKIDEAAKLFKFGDFEESKSYITSFLIEMKPIVSDLIETSDALLYVNYHGSVDGEPKDVDDLLFTRAKMLFDTYRANFSISP